MRVIPLTLLTLANLTGAIQAQDTSVVITKNANNQLVLTWTGTELQERPGMDPDAKFVRTANQTSPQILPPSTGLRFFRAVTGEIPWIAPTGIPVPPIGITNTHWMYTNVNYTFNYGNGPEPYRRNEFGPYTHYIHANHPASTDSSNPFGTPEKPRRTWVYPLPAGSCLQVHGGPYDFSNSSGGKMAVGGAGTEELPMYLYGTTTDRANMAHITRGEFYVYGNWLTVEKIKFTSTYVATRPSLKGAPATNICVRDCYLFGNGNSRNALTTGGSGGGTESNYTKNFVVLRNEIHGYGDRFSSSEDDTVGFLAAEFSTNCWALDNHIYHMSGDSARLGADQGGNPTSSHVYMGRNHMHDNRENAIDVKQARNAVISDNDMHGFLPSSSSGGTAFTMHYLPRNVWVMNNRVHNANRGIVSTGVGTDVYIIGNYVYDCEDGMYLDRGGGTFHVINNTIVDCINGILSTAEITGMHVVNNIFANMRGTSGHHLRLDSSTAERNSTAFNNLFFQNDGSVRIRWAGSSYSSATAWILGSSKGLGSLVANPGFTSEATADFHVSPTSPARNTGLVRVDLDVTFQQAFPASMLYDRDGDLRPTVGWDIGADEGL